MSEKLKELISLLYQDRLTQCGKRSLVENIEKLQKENEELKVNNDKTIKEGREAILYYTKYSIPKQVIRDKIKELSKYRDLAKELIEHKIVVADSDSLNYGRSEAHDKDIQVLKELLGE